MPLKKIVFTNFQFLPPYPLTYKLRLTPYKPAVAHVRSSSRISPAGCIKLLKFLEKSKKKNKALLSRALAQGQENDQAPHPCLMAVTRSSPTLPASLLLPGHLGGRILLTDTFIKALMPDDQYLDSMTWFSPIGPTHRRRSSLKGS